MFNNIISVDQFNVENMSNIFQEAIILEESPPPHLAGKILTNLFYEPSTRTSSSFHSAMVSLGGSVIPINSVEYSSVSKGENLSDTIRTLGSYSDIIVLRSKEEGDAKFAAEVSDVPIINAGDGHGEHPTQALLDVYTIFKETNQINGLSITVMGDLKYGRTVHSLVKLLRLYDVKINFVSPPNLRIPAEYKNPNEKEYFDIEDVISDTDVLYVTRAQKERFKEGETSDPYRLGTIHLPMMKTNAIIMHPLPRNWEIEHAVDKDPRAAYFRQMKNGLYIRRALLKILLINDGL